MKICAVSDTHQRQLEIPACDVLIHAGDICTTGTPEEFKLGIDWLADQPAKYKIYVPGNHDRFAHQKQDNAYWMCFDRNIAMLVCSRVVIEEKTFWGSPWTREYGWTRAYMYRASKDYEAWQPLRDYIDSDNENIDVLITHSPPAGILDYHKGNPLGSPALYDIVRRYNPAYHIFGHIHEGHGEFQVIDNTIYANVARLDGNYEQVADPIFTFEL